MIYKVETSLQAEEDLRGIFEYIAFELLSPENAGRQLERLAAGFPGMGLCLTEPEALAAAGALLAALPPRYWEESHSATEEAAR